MTHYTWPYSIRQYRPWYNLAMSFMKEQPRLADWINKHRPWHWKKDREKNFPLWVPKRKRPKTIRSCYRYIYPSIVEDVKLGSHWWDREREVVEYGDGVCRYADTESCAWPVRVWKSADQRAKVKELKPIPPNEELSIYPPERIYGNSDIWYDNKGIVIAWTMYSLPKWLLAQGYYAKGGMVYNNNGVRLCSVHIRNSHKRYRPYGLPCVCVPTPNGRCASHGGNAPRGLASPAHIKIVKQEMEELYGNNHW
jgi:hypothetical protein